MVGVSIHGGEGNALGQGRSSLGHKSVSKVGEEIEGAFRLHDGGTLVSSMMPADISRSILGQRISPASSVSSGGGVEAMEVWSVMRMVWDSVYKATLEEGEATSKRTVGVDIVRNR